MSILKKIFGEKKKPVTQNKPIEEVASAVKVKPKSPTDTSTFLNRNMPSFKEPKKEESTIINGIIPPPVSVYNPTTGVLEHHFISDDKPFREEFPLGRSESTGYTGSTSGMTQGTSGYQRSSAVPKKPVRPTGRVMSGDTLKRLMEDRKRRENSNGKKLGL